MYKTVQDADFRLTSSVILSGDEPILVEAIRAGPDGVSPQLIFRSHPFSRESKQTTLLCSDPRLDFKTPALGYVNYFEDGNRHVIFGERLPVRRNKQGLTGENTQFIGQNGTPYGWDRVRRSSGFAECIRGEYPTYDVALERLIPDSSIAVSKDFAILCDGAGGFTLLYRRAKVGVFFRGQLYLSNDKQWLLETIAEEPNLPNNAEVM